MSGSGKVALAVAVWVAAASAAQAQTTTLVDVERAEASWHAVAPRDYTITLIVHAFTPGSHSSPRFQPVTSMAAAKA